MNQTITRMIGKLEEDKKACWSEHLLELLMAYNATHSTVTGYSPYYLLFGRRPRIPVDYLFPTLHDSPHQTKMEVSVVAMQRRLKEAFTIARHLTSEDNAVITIRKQELLLYSLETLLWFMPMASWASGRYRTDGKMEASLLSLSWRTGLSIRSDV